MNTAVSKSNGDNEWNSSIGERVSGLTKKAYGWTKYGGTNLGLVQDGKTIEWSCQVCSDVQASDLPSYMFEFIENEFIRICSICQAEKIAHHVLTLQELIEATRKAHAEFDM